MPSVVETSQTNGLLPGTLDMLILTTLARGPMHGHGIAQLIRQVSGDVLSVGEGSLYPALRRLLANGWVAAHWGISTNNRRARFYRLTPAGRKQLKIEMGNFARVIGAIARVMRTAKGESAH